MTPEDAAAALLDKAGLTDLAELPIDVDHLAEEIDGLDVQEHADLTRAAERPSCPPGTTLSGLLLPAEKRVWVNAVEARRSAGRRRFTIAHELGHWQLHCRRRWTPTRGSAARDEVGATDARGARPRRRIEREANRFAAALLMPEPLVRERGPATPAQRPGAGRSLRRVSSGDASAT